jgi:hypothetical protein
MGFEWMALEAACPFNPSITGSHLTVAQFQCWLYSHTGLFLDVPAGSPTPSCETGRHVEGAECVLNGWHSIGNGRACPNGTHAQDYRGQMSARHGRPNTEAFVCKFAVEVARFVLR